MQGHNQGAGNVVRMSDSEGAVATSAGHETPAKPVTGSSNELPVATSQVTRSNGEEVVSIALDSLVDDEGNFRPIQVREQVDQDVVNAYAAAMLRGEADKFPPIEVFAVIERDRERYIAGGLHRCTAARQAGLTALRGYLREGTWHEALKAAVTTNATHGHRPTFGDVCATLLQMEHDPEYRGLPNTAKATLIGVSEGTVRNAYKHLRETSQVTKSDAVTVTRKDGTTYQLPVSHAGETSNVARSGNGVDQPPEPVVQDPAAAAQALHAVVARAREVVDEMRTWGLDGAVVPQVVMAAYRAGSDAARLKAEAQTVKAAAHLLGTLAEVALGKAA